MSGFLATQRPLVLCIDDLQWADSTSLSLLIQLVIGVQASDANDVSLLLLGAYRTKDKATVTVREAVARLRDANVTMQEIELRVLSRADTHAMLTDMFSSSSPCDLDALTEVVMKKTLGNPFFALRFLQGAYHDCLVRFEFDRGQWTWDLVRCLYCSFVHLLTTNRRQWRRHRSLITLPRI